VFSCNILSILKKDTTIVFLNFNFKRVQEKKIG